MKNNLINKINLYKSRGIEYYAMRSILNKTLRDRIIKIITSKRGKNYKLTDTNKSNFINLDTIQGHVENMKYNGYTKFDNILPLKILNSILKSIENLDCQDPYRKHLGNVDLCNPSKETHIAHYKREDLVNIPEIREIANDSGLLAIAQEFLGATPTISNINMWWSFGEREQAEEAQLFHRDVDDWKFCKLFIYLTDVSEENGPHIYVKGSSISPEYRKIRRYQDFEIEAKFGKENIITFIEPKGSTFMVDTYGFHKGLLPRTGKRLLLQVQYSLNPLAVEKYNPIAINSQSAYFDLYINRLILSKQI